MKSILLLAFIVAAANIVTGEASGGSYLPSATKGGCCTSRYKLHQHCANSKAAPVCQTACDEDSNCKGYYLGQPSFLSGTYCKIATTTDCSGTFGGMSGWFQLDNGETAPLDLSVDCYSSNYAGCFAKESSSSSSSGDCEACVDLGFVVDSSGSLKLYDDDGNVTPGNYDVEKSFMKQIANNLGLSTSGVHASVVQFSKNAKLEIEFLDDITKFTSRVDAMKWMKSTTRIDLGLDVAYKEMFQTSNGMRESEDCSKIVVVMTDGENANDFPLSELTTKQFHDDGIKVEVIGIGKNVKDKELLTLVKSDSSYHKAQKFGVLVTDSFMNGIVNCEKLSAKDCQWADWVIGECDKDCGTGLRTNTRIKKVEETNGGRCDGASMEIEDCNTIPCIVDCEWDEWVIGQCSKTCGGGLLTKTRQVLVNEDNGGNACVGSNSVTESCNVNECPYDCAWGEWITPECSVTCGGGFLIKYREKIEEEKYGGTCFGETSEEEACNLEACPEGQGVIEGCDENGGKFFAFDSTKVTEEVCTGLCSEMPKCTSLTFRAVVEEDKWGKTQAGQCRFKNGVTRENLFDKPTRISFFKNEDGSYEKFIDQGIGRGEFLFFNAKGATEAACKKLCKEMPRCVEAIFDILVCRFSTA